GQVRETDDLLVLDRALVHGADRDRHVLHRLRALCAVTVTTCRPSDDCAPDSWACAVMAPAASRAAAWAIAVNAERRRGDGKLIVSPDNNCGMRAASGVID
ncbi:hypothetical protein, partial [Acinetobacter baumannii]